MAARGAKAAPIRTCVACRQRRPQAELLRLAQGPEGWRADPRRRLPGRGVYVCRREACFTALAQGKAALRGFRGTPPRQALARLAAAVEFRSLLGPDDQDLNRI